MKYPCGVEPYASEPLQKRVRSIKHAVGSAFGIDRNKPPGTHPMCLLPPHLDAFFTWESSIFFIAFFIMVDMIFIPRPSQSTWCSQPCLFFRWEFYRDEPFYIGRAYTLIINIRTKICIFNLGSGSIPSFQYSLGITSLLLCI